MPTASPDVGDKWPEVKTELCNRGFSTHSTGTFFFFFFERMMLRNGRVCNRHKGYTVHTAWGVPDGKKAFFFFFYFLFR